jgi:hypothetical protein
MRSSHPSRDVLWRLEKQLHFFKAARRQAVLEPFYHGLTDPPPVLGAKSQAIHHIIC